MPRYYLPVPLEMLADGDGLLDQVVEVLGDGRSEALRLQDTQDLVAGDKTHLGDTVRVTQDHTCVRKCASRNLVERRNYRFNMLMLEHLFAG